MDTTHNNLDAMSSDIKTGPSILHDQMSLYQSIDIYDPDLTQSFKAKPYDAEKSSKKSMKLGMKHY